MIKKFRIYSFLPKKWNFVLTSSFLHVICRACKPILYSKVRKIWKMAKMVLKNIFKSILTTNGLRFTIPKNQPCIDFRTQGNYQSLNRSNFQKMPRKCLLPRKYFTSSTFIRKNHKSWWKCLRRSKNHRTKSTMTRKPFQH